MENSDLGPEMGRKPMFRVREVSIHAEQGLEVTDTLTGATEQIRTRN